VTIVGLNEWGQACFIVGIPIFGGVVAHGVGKLRDTSGLSAEKKAEVFP
jgi:hypothetical protein